MNRRRVDLSLGAVFVAVGFVVAAASLVLPAEPMLVFSFSVPAAAMTIALSATAVIACVSGGQFLGRSVLGYPTRYRRELLQRMLAEARELSQYCLANHSRRFADDSSIHDRHLSALVRRLERSAVRVRSAWGTSVPDDLYELISASRGTAEHEVLSGAPKALEEWGDRLAIRMLQA